MHNQNGHPATCIIVDDEPMARAVIRRYIEQVPLLSLEGEFGNAIDATFFLYKQQVDIIFLDIQMPQLSGIEFVRTLRRTPKIIFTTAFKEYAHEGFDLDAIDYLVKPVRFDRFLRAIDKAIPRVAEKESRDLIVEEESKTLPSFIYLRVDRKMVKILLEDILYIESDKDYVKVFTPEGHVFTRQTIASVEAMLPASQFVRIHRSFIVSLARIKSFTNENVEVGSKVLPVGKLYRNSFIKTQE